jgi:hypothetical protein
VQYARFIYSSRHLFLQFAVLYLFYINIDMTTGRSSLQEVLLNIESLGFSRVFRICGPKREVDGSWRKLHNDELHRLCSSQNVVRVIKSRILRWA